jgi:hypothetical protein
MKNSVSGLVSSGSVASSAMFSNIISSPSFSSFNPVQLKVKNDLNGNRSAGGVSDESGAHLGNTNTNENKQNSDSTRIFRNTINLIVDNNNSAFNKNNTSNTKTESNAQKTTTSKALLNTMSNSNANISKNIDLNDSEELDNINITVNLFDAYSNNNNNINNNSLIIDHDNNLNNSIGSSLSSNNKKSEKLHQTFASSDYENDSIISSKANKVSIFNYFSTIKAWGWKFVNLLHRAGFKKIINFSLLPTLIF